MEVIKISLMGLFSASLILLGACSNSDKAANSQSTAATTTEAKTEEKPKDPTKHTHTSQVVQLERYHIDLRPDPDGDFIHLDTKIHDLQDRPIIDATIGAQTIKAIIRKVRAVAKIAGARSPANSTASKANPSQVRASPNKLIV